jgi:polyadenylate-binding protein 2
MATEEQEVKDERLETHEEGGDDEVSRAGAGDGA